MLTIVTTPTQLSDLNRSVAFFLQFAARSAICKLWLIVLGESQQLE